MADKQKMRFRLFRMWQAQAHLDFMFMTRDVKFFLLNICSDLITSFAGVTAVFLLAERFNGIGMWTRDQIIFLLGYGTLVGGVMEAFFGYNVLHVSRRLGRGQFDHTLIQPRPVWMAFLTEGFMPFSGCWTLLMGVGIIAWSVSALGLTLSPFWCLAFGINLLSSCAVVVSFSFTWGSLSFRAPMAAEEISSWATRIMTQLKTFPLDGVGTALTYGLLSVLPVGFVSWYPCRQLLGIEESTGGLWRTPMASVVLVLFSIWVFKKGMDYYGKTGSQRYLPWGHRG